MSQANGNTYPIRSRRAVRAGIAAGAAVAAAIPAAAVAAAPAADPVFDLIQIHRKAHSAHVASLNLQDRFERRFGVGEGSWISEKPCHDENDAFVAFEAEPAATLAGLFAKLAYLEELANEFETEWMVRDRADVSVIIQSFAVSLKNIGGCSRDRAIGAMATVGVGLAQAMKTLNALSETSDLLSGKITGPRLRTTCPKFSN
jgi:hypothetical protein